MDVRHKSECDGRLSREPGQVLISQYRLQSLPLSTSIVDDAEYCHMATQAKCRALSSAVKWAFYLILHCLCNAFNLLNLHMHYQTLAYDVDDSA